MAGIGRSVCVCLFFPSLVCLRVLVSELCCVCLVQLLCVFVCIPVSFSVVVAQTTRQTGSKTDVEIRWDETAFIQRRRRLSVGLGLSVCLGVWMGGVGEAKTNRQVM